MVGVGVGGVVGAGASLRRELGSLADCKSRVASESACGMPADGPVVELLAFLRTGAMSVASL